MALFYCSECGNRISDKAYNCPKCGAPTGRIKEVKISRADQLKEGDDILRLSVLIVCAFVVLIIVLLLVLSTI